MTAMWDVESATRRKTAMVARALAAAILDTWHSWSITSFFSLVAATMNSWLLCGLRVKLIDLI
jgi:hypothetical protein